MAAGERRIFRISQGAPANAETIMVRPANSADPTDYVTVPPGKVARLTDFNETVPTALNTVSIFRIRSGQALTGEEIMRVVTISGVSRGGSFKRQSFRIDGGAAGQDFVLTLQVLNQIAPAYFSVTAILNQD
jgi:hypothetical protein